jgi:hypothetical protein
MELDPLSLLNAAAAVATALGLAFAVIQLRIAARQSVTDFEDSMAAEYRALAATFPIEALLGGTLSDEQHGEALDEFYHYFDLSNGQIFLRRKGRVSRRTFDFWCSGIRAHLTRPAFARAWKDINARLPNDFRELRRLITDDFRSDPKHWT